MKFSSFNKSYYKIRIIITFCVITVVVVLILSFFSYRFIRNLYLEQLSEQVKVVTGMISNQIDKRYLELLQVGIPTKTTEKYFRDFFDKNINSKYHSEMFIFDKNFYIVVHSDSNVISGTADPRLFLNQKEILNEKINQSSASLPFKGNDGNWYLWGFYRLNNNYWLGLRESAARLEKVEEFSKLFWIVGICGAVISIILGWLIAQSITKPVNKLAKFSSEIGQGNFSSEMPAETKGEINFLAKSMDKMKNDLLKNDKEKEKILAQIAHEIRNPLGGIELFANLTKEDLEKENFNSEYLDKILYEVNSLKSLITSYLNYSRPTLPNPELVDLKSLFCEVKNIFSKEISGKNLQFVTNGEAGKIWFDYGHLKQILINLVSNSIECSNEDGIIKIFSKRKNNLMQIFVKDNGAGISPENLQNIFDPFFTTKKNGTGLGLSICRKLCSENKASLNVKNNEDKGIVFIIEKDFTNER